MPELGQMVFGQPWKSYEASIETECALKTIQGFMAALNNFGDTAFEFGKFKNDVFEVEAYSWDDEYDQPYNFKWRDFEVSWYKHLGRGVTCNRGISRKELKEMVVECIKSLLNENK